jgi:hypothetical protein
VQGTRARANHLACVISCNEELLSIKKFAHRTDARRRGCAGSSAIVVTSRAWRVACGTEHSRTMGAHPGRADKWWSASCTLLAALLLGSLELHLVRMPRSLSTGRRVSRLAHSAQRLLLAPAPTSLSPAAPERSRSPALAHRAAVTTRRVALLDP